MNLLSYLIYVPLQIVFIPLALIGAIWVGYKQIGISKKLGLSHTAIEIINGRWTMHIFGLRDDPATANLAKRLENTSTFGLWLVLFPLWVKYKISGRYFLYPKPPEAGNEGVADLVSARTTYIDEIIYRELSEMEQFVAMGAGYDTRSFGMLGNTDITRFELDQEAVQQHKRAHLDALGIGQDVRFVTVDFTKDNAFVKLVQAGFNKSRRTLFLWEGVTLYLSEDEVKATLRDFREHSSTGSVMLVDIYADRFINSMTKSAAARKSLEATGELLSFGLPFESDFETALRAFIEGESLSLGETHFLGSSGDNGPYAVVAEVLHGH